ncbi:MAG: trigger factor, partial [Spirochaetes bacterium GWF1_41_5]
TMEITATHKTENASCTLDIEVNENTVKKEYQEIFNDFSKNAQIPGFRRGKVPFSLLKTRFGSTLQAETLNSIIQKASKKAIEDAKIEPLGQPQIDTLPEFTDAAPLKFSVKVELMPYCEIKSYEKLAYTDNNYKTDEKDIEYEINRILETRAIPQDKNGPAAEKDAVTCDIDVIIKGSKIASESKVNTTYRLEEKFIPFKLYKKFLGAKVGDEIKISYVFEKDYKNQETAGEKAEITAKINTVKSMIKPELNDEFAKKNGYDSVAVMKEDIARQIDEYIKSVQKRENEKALLDSLSETTFFAISRSVIDFEYNRSLSALIKQFGGDKNNLLKWFSSMGQTEERYAENRKKDINIEYQKELMLAKIQSNEKIEITDDAVNKAIEEYAAQQKNTDVPGLRKEMLKDGRYETVKNNLRRQAALDFLKTKAQVKKGKIITYRELSERGNDE